MNRKKLLELVTYTKNKIDARYNPSQYLSYDKEIYAEFIILMKKISNEIKDLQYYIENLDIAVLTNKEAKSALNYILKIINLEEKYKDDLNKRNIFQSGKDKLKEAAICFKNGDFSGTMNNLNTSLELLLKEKIDIPTTIPINTTKIIEILISQNVGPVEFLKQVKKYVTPIDNETKHRGYNPDKKDCIKAIRAMEELASQLEKSDIVLDDEIKDKIYSGL